MINRGCKDDFVDFGTHEQINEIAEAELLKSMTTREQIKALKGESINLETIPLKDVPLNGVFVYQTPVSKAYHIYKKTRLCTRSVYGDMALGLSIWDTKTGDSHLGEVHPIAGKTHVAYTGIIMQG